MAVWERLATPVLPSPLPYYTSHMTEPRIECFTGGTIEPYLQAVAQLRIEVFREYPYLYDGTLAYETNYLKTYTEAPEGLFVLVFDGSDVVGASTGVPLDQGEDAFQAPFHADGYDPARVFYCGESVLRRDYRGRGLGVRFFEEREGYARALGRFDYTAFCAVERPEAHPQRPAGYAPLDAFWQRRGYVKHPELKTTFRWRDLDEAHESPKPMVFWLKPLAP